VIIKISIVALFVAVLVVGCAPMLEVSNNFDPETNFAQYATYDLAPKDQLEMSAETAAKFSGKRDLIDEEIVKALTAEMEAKGFKRDTENPDIVVVYLLGVRREVFAADFGYEYAFESGMVSTQTVQDGAMRIDMIDNETKIVVWQGEGYGAVNRDPTEDMIRKNIDRAVKKILDQYPPDKKKR